MENIRVIKIENGYTLSWYVVGKNDNGDYDEIHTVVYFKTMDELTKKLTEIIG